MHKTRITSPRKLAIYRSKSWTTPTPPPAGVRFVEDVERWQRVSPEKTEDASVYASSSNGSKLLSA